MTAPAVAAAATTEQLSASGSEKPPVDPGKWALTDAEKVVGQQTPDWVKRARLYVVDGDHWQMGNAWIGPKPSPSEDGFQLVMRLIETGFVSRNVLAEVSERYTNGIVGYEPTWQLVPKRKLKKGEAPNAAEQALIDEIEGPLTQWWDEGAIAELFWDAVYQMTWGARGPMRLFLSGNAFEALSTNGTQRRVVRKPTTLEDALRLILLDVPSIESTAVYVNSSTREPIGVYTFKDEKGSDRAEISYLDRQRLTIMRTLGGAPGTDAPTPPANLAGQLTIFQMSRARLLTPQAFQLQDALNLALSNIPRTLITAGFLERFLINAKLPGTFIEINGEKRWQPDPNMSFGAGTTTALQGEEVEDEVTGRKTITTPEVIFREPVAVTGSLEARKGLYGALLEEVDQGHIMLTDEATPSGRSREQARHDHTSSLRTGKHRADRGGRWLFTTVLALVEHLMGTPGRFTSSLRLHFDTRLDAGPLSIEERAQDVAEWKENLRSRETVMLRGGITDPAAELATIESEPGAQLALAERQGEVMQTWVDLGANVQTAAEIAGVDEAIAGQLERDLFPTNPIENPGGEPAPAPEPAPADGGSPAAD